MNGTTRAALLAGAVVCNVFGTASAQEPSAEQIGAARDAVDAIGATDQFDSILIGAALQLKSTLIQQRPDQEAVISATVDEKALDLAGRRADLENEAARVYAEQFTLDQLNAIAEFYSSDAGQALLEKGPVATRGVLRAADIWGRGVGRDLAETVGASLNERLGTSADPATAIDGTPQAPQAQ